MEMFGLGDIEVVPLVFFLRDGVNDPLYLEDSFVNFARVLTLFNEEKIQEQMRGHIVSRCKEDKFEGVGVTNFGFIEGIPDVPWP